MAIHIRHNDNQEPLKIEDSQSEIDIVKCNMCSIREVCQDYHKGKICMTLAKDILEAEVAKMSRKNDQ